MMVSKAVEEARIKWGFCPRCGLNPKHVLNIYRHKDGKCKEK